MRKISALLVLAFAVMLATGCASSGPKKEEVNRMNILEAQLARILADLNELQTTSRNNTAAVAALRDEIRGQLDTMRSEGTKSLVKVETLEAKVDALVERMDDSELRISNMKKDITSLRIGRTGTAYTRPAGTSPDYQTSEPVDPTAEGNEEGMEITTPSNESESYQLAYNEFLRGEFSVAVTGFRNYLTNYPEGSQRQEAQFYLAESLYNLKNFESAVEEYDVLIIRYPDSPHLVNATYKKGLSFLESNQTAQGVILLKQLIRRFPESNEARLASNKLKNLGLTP